jgi:hypothetical protein
LDSLRRSLAAADDHEVLGHRMLYFRVGPRF